MTAQNPTLTLPKINIDAFKNNRKLVLYIVIGFSAISIISLVALIVWLATKDNVPNQPNVPTVTITPILTSVVGPTIISDIPTVESTKFLYIERVNGKDTGNLISYDLKDENKLELISSNSIKSIISISPNNKYLLIQTVNNLNKDEYCVYDFDTKSCDILPITTFIQSFWTSNDFLNYSYKNVDNDSLYVDSYNARERSHTRVLSIKDLVIDNPYISRNLIYLIGIDQSDDSYHIINLDQKTNQSIPSLDLISGSSFSPLLWNTDGRFVYSSSTGIFKLNPVLLNSTQLVSLSTIRDKLEVFFLNYNEDQKSLLFMLDGYIYRFNINTEILKEVLNLNSRTNFKLVDLKGNGQNFFIMENYDGMMEAFNIKNSKLGLICTELCKNPVWYY